MEPLELERELVEIAREAGIDVRVLTRRSSSQEPIFSAESGICVVKGKVWVVISMSDPLEERIHTLAKAVVKHAPDFLETRFISPAIRERLDSISSE